MTSAGIAGMVRAKEELMATQVDHSMNLPREFRPCPLCGKRGVFFGSLKSPEGSAGAYHIRCKYCGHEKFVDADTWMGIDQELIVFGYK